MLLQSLSGRRRRASERRGGIKVWARSRNPPSASAASESVLFPRGTILSLQKSRREGAGRGAVVGEDGWIGSSGFGQMSAKPEGRSGGRVDRPGTSQHFADAPSTIYSRPLRARSGCPSEAEITKLALGRAKQTNQVTKSSHGFEIPLKAGMKCAETLRMKGKIELESYLWAMDRRTPWEADKVSG